MPLYDQDVFLNVVGGLRVDEPSADLAAALAIVSSVRDHPLPPDMVALGELGLSGELRGVGQLEQRLREAGKLGFALVRWCPRRAVARAAATCGLAAIPVPTLRDAVRAARALSRCELAIVLVAAGSSTRMGFPKLWTDVDGQPLLAPCDRGAPARPSPPSWSSSSPRPRGRSRRALAPGRASCAGGARRRDSVAAGLAASTAPLAGHPRRGARPGAARAVSPRPRRRPGHRRRRPRRAAQGHHQARRRRPRGRRPRHAPSTSPSRRRRFSAATCSSARWRSTDADVTDEAALVEQLGIDVAVFPRRRARLQNHHPTGLRACTYAARGLSEKDVVSRFLASKVGPTLADMQSTTPRSAAELVAAAKQRIENLSADQVATEMAHGDALLSICASPKSSISGHDPGLGARAPRHARVLRRPEQPLPSRGV